MWSLFRVIEFEFEKKKISTMWIPFYVITGKWFLFGQTDHINRTITVITINKSSKK